jgi:hypothetical protein
MTNIVPLTKPFAPDDIPATLRRIADAAEKGEYGLMTTCLVVMGHTDHKDDPGGGPRIQQERYDLFGCGPRCDAFTTRGLLLTVATRELGNE